MISVYDYLDYRRFLQDRYLEGKASSKSFSFRQFSSKAGFASSSTLKMVLTGQRNLTAASASKCARAFKMPVKEVTYFENLVLFNQAQSEKDKDYYWKKLLRAKPKAKLTALQKKQYRLFEQRYYFVIREMVSLPDFKEDYAWIADNVFPKIKLPQAKEAVATLLELDLLRRDENGRLVQSHQSLTTPPEVESMDLFQFQRLMQNDAKDAIDKFDREERDLSTLIIPIQKDKIQDVRLLIQEFKENLIEFINASGSNYHEVFYINVEMFPATTTKKQAVVL